MRLVDAHCHLDDVVEVEAALARARGAGLVHLVVNGLWRAPGDFGNAFRLARHHPELVSPTVAIHPHDCARAGAPDWLDCERLAADAVAIGETGLDYHYDHSPREAQREAFRRTIALARSLKKPLVVHVREADPDAAQILREERAADLGGQIHCFTGDRAAARLYLDLGFHLSFSGVVTFKTAEEIRQAMLLTPLERLLIETDSPYLAPVPHRGKKNEPSLIVHVAAVVAQLRGLAVEELAEATVRNAERLFGLRIGAGGEPAAGGR